MKRKNKIIMRFALAFFILTIILLLYTNIKYMFKLTGWEILFYHTYEAIVIPGVPFGICVFLTLLVYLDEKGD